MKILIIGLGLIGGSFARALKYYDETDGGAPRHEVHGFDPDITTVRKALLVGACDEAWDKLPPLAGYDVILLAAYPRASVEFIENHAAEISPETYVLDLGGIKRVVCEAGFAAARAYGFTFIGGHPMAGTQFSGFGASKESMFTGASMILVPPQDIDAAHLDFAVKFVKSVGFSAVSVTTAKNHDEIIAYTSQLAHVLSNAYVKSPTAKRHRGYSAGSFRDLTRVAHLNAKMWAELFMDNGDVLVPEIEGLAHALLEYADAIKAGDEARLTTLLAEGSAINDDIKNG